MKNRDLYQIIALQVIFAIFALMLFFKEQYGWTVVCLALLLIANRLDTLKKLIVSPKQGIEAEFESKIIENIIENKEPVDEHSYQTLKEMYQEVENKVFKHISSKYGASAKIYREYRLSGNFIADIYVERPNGSNEIYEIKYIKSEAVARTIAKSGEKQLLKYASLLNSQVKLSLILASKQTIDIARLNLSDNISVEFFKL